MKERSKVIVYSGVVDLRKGYWGLKGLIGNLDPDVLYLFSNRSRNLCKVLSRDRFGIEVWTRRLNQGSFQWPENPTGITEINTEEMRRIFAGKKVKKI
jgi:hypothetical protein